MTTKKKKIRLFSKKKEKHLSGNVVAIKGEWFSEMGLTGGDIFQPALSNHATIRINQKNNFPHDTKLCICTNKMNNGWNTHIFQIFCEERDIILFIYLEI